MAQHKQFGGTLSGFVLGLVIGLTIALGVAMYVTKVPMPFSNKNLSRSAEQDAAEAEKNKDWNPNSALQNKPAIAAPAEGAAASEPASSAASSATPFCRPRIGLRPSIRLKLRHHGRTNANTRAFCSHPRRQRRSLGRLGQGQTIRPSVQQRRCPQGRGQQ